MPRHLDREARLAFGMPAGASTLQQFSFWISTNGDETSPSATFEAFVMGWSGAPTGPVLYRSGVLVAPAVGANSEVTFLTDGVPWVPGAPDVAFVSPVSGLLVHRMAGTVLPGESTFADSYGDGEAVFSFDEPSDPVQACPWTAFSFDGRDRVFVATFGVATVPEAATSTLLGVGLLTRLVSRRRIEGAGGPRPRDRRR